MEISVFIREYAPLAGEAGRAFRIDPVVILAQAAIETGWGESTLCRKYHNFLRHHGLRAAQRMVDRPVDGAVAPLATFPGSTRDDKCSFMDYCRLLRSAYPLGGRHERQPVRPSPRRSLTAPTSAR